MARKCYTKLETTKERCPIVFQGHQSNFKVTRDKTSPALTQIGRFRTIGRSQLSNPSDLPCSNFDAIWLSETRQIWGFQAYWLCSVDFPHYRFLGIIWRTCGSKCRGEGGGIFPTLCVEFCLVGRYFKYTSIEFQAFLSYISGQVVVVKGLLSTFDVLIMPRMFPERIPNSNLQRD